MRGGGGVGVALVRGGGAGWVGGWVDGGLGVCLDVCVWGGAYHDAVDGGGKGAMVRVAGGRVGGCVGGAYHDAVDVVAPPPGRLTDGHVCVYVCVCVCVCERARACVSASARARASAS